MFRNYLKTAIRNLWRNKGFSGINIIGLAIGLTTCLFILFYVSDELSYDNYNQKAERIYRVDSDIKFGGRHFVMAQSPDPLGVALKTEFPQVTQYVRLRDHGGILLKKGSENIREERVILADSTLFDVFTLPMIEGNPGTALVNPNSVVITKTMAGKYFPGVAASSIVGNTLIINNDKPYKITGIIEDVPKASHFHFDFFISMYGQLAPYEIDQWTSNNFNTYIVLDHSADPEKISKQLDDFVMKKVAPILKMWSLSVDDFKKQGNYLHYDLMPLNRIHLFSQKEGELGINGNIQYVGIFSLIALFILLIACVNFMNLSTARSSARAKEIGVRKVMGSMRKDVVTQFLTESILMSLVSMILAFVMISFLMPYFNRLTGKELAIHDFFTPYFLGLLLILVLVVGLLAGVYPAFYLSSFKPTEVLKSKVATGFKTGWLRNGLVVFQFAISIFLIIGSIVIYSQLHYIRNKDVGYNRDQVLIIKNTDALGKKAAVFKEEVLRLNDVHDATMTGYLPTPSWRNYSPLYTESTADTKSAVSTQIWKIDENYIGTLGMKIVKGRNFSNDFKTDSSGILINESFAKQMGEVDPLNKPLYHLKNFPVHDVTQYHIVGVVKDFNFNSLHDQVTPLVFLFGSQDGNIAFRVQPKHIDQLIASIERIYKKTAPGQPFSYSFMDADFNNTYQAERKMGALSITFSLLAIFIACLGLFGLVTFSATQRTKEIGIRKILGAGIPDVILMLSKDFLKLVLIAALISFPVGWWAMNKWLQNFAYRIDISWWVFLVAGMSSILIALITVSFQAIRAAIANPVDSLRSE